MRKHHSDLEPPKKKQNKSTPAAIQNPYDTVNPPNKTITNMPEISFTVVNEADVAKMLIQDVKMESTSSTSHDIDLIPSVSVATTTISSNSVEKEIVLQLPGMEYLGQWREIKMLHILPLKYSTGIL